MKRVAIETGRLLLRAHHIDDYRSYWGFWKSQTPPTISGGPPRDSEEAWSRLLRFIGHWHQFKFGSFLIFDKMSKELIGEAGYSYIPRGLGLHFDEYPQAGWNIAPAFRKRGIGQQAASACTAWMDEHFPGRSVCMIHPHNEASIKIATTVGFQPYGEAEYKYTPVTLFERETVRH